MSVNDLYLSHNQESLPNQLIPVKEEHSITEAIFALFLAQPILQPSRFRNLLTEGSFKGNYSKFAVRHHRKLTAEYNITRNEFIKPDSGPESKEVGFIFESFKEGLPEYALQTEAMDVNILSLHSYQYDRWKGFITRFQNDIKEVAKVQSSIFLNGFGLSYIDQFMWNGETFPNMRDLLVPNKYLPELIIEAEKDWNYTFTTRRMVNGLDIVEHISMGIRHMAHQQFLLTVAHNVANNFEELIELSEENIFGIITEKAEALHSLNKEFLAACLKEETQNLIHLKSN